MLKNVIGLVAALAHVNPLDAAGYVVQPNDDSVPRLDALDIGSLVSDANGVKLLAKQAQNVKLWREVLVGPESRPLVQIDFCQLIEGHGLASKSTKEMIGIAHALQTSAYNGSQKIAIRLIKSCYIHWLSENIREIDHKRETTCGFNQAIIINRVMGACSTKPPAKATIVDATSELLCRIHQYELERYGEEG
jgi:hypothetical protein